MEDYSNRRKAALRLAAEALKLACDMLLAALYDDFRRDSMWERARNACEAAREFSAMLADDGLAAWREWERCEDSRARALERGTPESFEALCGEVDVAWNLYEDVRWGALRELKTGVSQETA